MEVPQTSCKGPNALKNPSISHPRTSRNKIQLETLYCITKTHAFPKPRHKIPVNAVPKVWGAVLMGVVAAAAAFFFLELAIIIPGALFGTLTPGFRV